MMKNGQPALNLRRLCAALLTLTPSLPANALEPDQFDHSVSNGTTLVTIHFSRSTVRGPNFSVLLHDASGAFNVHTPGEVRTYLGTVENHPGAIASGMRRADGRVFSRISFEDGTEWVSHGAAATIRTDDWSPAWPEFVPAAGGAGSVIYAAEVGVDVPRVYYQSAGGTAAAALEMIEFSVNSANIIYLRDVGIVHRLGRVIIRTSATTDPYEEAGGNMNTLLTTVREQWSNVLPASTQDLTLVATTLASGNGLGTVGNIGPNAASANGGDVEGDFTTVWRHEGGHNWSLGHFDGGTPEGRTINSGNRLARTSGPEQQKIVSHRDTRLDILDNLGPFGLPIPPRAAADRAEFEPNVASVVLDVINNDHDGNGQSLSLLSMDTVSAAGGSLTRSTGTGPAGRDQVLYTPPTSGLAGLDHFTYRLQDAGGQQALGNVMLRYTYAGDIAGHWTFDEGTGSTATDSSSFVRNGELINGPAWTTGNRGGALSFDGINDHVEVDALELNTNRVTLTAWVRRNGSQASWAGLIFCRGGSTTAGLNFGEANELRYHWNGAQWPWDSGLIVPDDVWTFVALVVEPTRAIIYMHDGTRMRTAVNTANHPVEAFDATLQLGRDPAGSTRRLNGLLDDARVYRRALSSTEIEALFNGLGSPASPNPAMADVVLSDNLFLSWTPAPSAVAHRVYLSPDYATVRDRASAADQGQTASPSWAPPPLAPGTYFWRVEESDGTATASGPIWSFTVVDALVAHWKLDETSGSVAIEELGGHHGTYLNGPTPGQTGASLGTRTSASFDGSNDRIDVPYSADLNPATFTASVWAKPAGGSGAFRSPLTSRDDPPQRGYIFYAANNNTWQFWLGTGTGWASLTGPPVVLGQWVHLAGSYDGTTARFYVNGIEVDSRNTGFSPNAARPLRLGAGATEGNGSFFFPGSVDDVQIWSRALSAETISSFSIWNSWVSSTGLTPGVNAEPQDDPDHDGCPNIKEFALNGDPLNGDTDGKQRAILTDLGGIPHFTFTFPARYKANFQGSPDLSTTVDGLVYRLRGFDHVSNGSALVVQGVDPSFNAGLPPLSDGWSYRTVRFVDPVATLAIGFMELTVEEEQ